MICLRRARQRARRGANVREVGCGGCQMRAIFGVINPRECLVCTQIHVEFIEMCVDWA